MQVFVYLYIITDVPLLLEFTKSCVTINPISTHIVINTQCIVNGLMSLIVSDALNPYQFVRWLMCYRPNLLEQYLAHEMFVIDALNHDQFVCLLMRY